MVTTMGMRRRARETALQVLYQLDAQPELGVDASLARFYGNFSEEATPGGAAALDEARAFADRLVHGVVEHLEEIDARIGHASRNWRLERMGRVDRNLLRLAVYEMCFCDDIPGKVAINEAIEIAKRFGAQETPAFVNGVLDRVLEES
jgi:N utilization substance protein B